MRDPEEKKWARVIGLSLFVCVALLDVPTSAQTVELVGDGRVTVQAAEGVVLINLLRELESVVPIEQILLDPAVDGKLVRVTLKEVPFRKAIEEVLAAAEVNHVVWGKDDGPFRIFAGSAQQTRPVPLSERAEGLDRSVGPGESQGSPQPHGSGGSPDGSQTPGPGRPASAEAYLEIPPRSGRLAATLAILVVGFLSGRWMLGPESHRVRSRHSDALDEAT